MTGNARTKPTSPLQGFRPRIEFRHPRFCSRFRFFSQNCENFEVMASWQLVAVVLGRKMAKNDAKRQNTT